MRFDGVGTWVRPNRRRFLGTAIALGVGVALPRTAAAAPAVGTRMAAAPSDAATALLPDVPWHLTARPWQPSGQDASGFLDVGEWIAREHARHQADDGSILDAYSGREQQYQTPYFAVSVAMLVTHGRATDLLPQGIAAMERATAALSQGRSRIPENHGEFYVAAVAKALPLYRPHVPAAQYDAWRTRLATPLGSILQGLSHNWRTYAMKGEWLRAKNGLVDRVLATAWIEASWLGSQRARLQGTRWNQYADRSGTPDTHVYDAAARSNLFALITEGYDGPSAPGMTALLERGALTSLLMQEPSGQNPAGGRSGDHVWNDVYSGNVFAQMAEHHRESDPQLAGRYRRAALMNLASLSRWRRPEGAYSVTKNHFDPADRVGYASYSWFQNYNGNVMFHSLESFESAAAEVAAVPEQPVPAEIGGYAFATDPAVFGSAFANAGGMHMQAALVGADEVSYGQYWTVLGVTRFGRAGWDGRLGPSNGVRDPGSGRAVSFAPSFPENGGWSRLGELADRYEGTASFEFVHPLLVRWAIDYAPARGRSGPAFRHEFVVTPDGVLATLTSDTTAFGVTLPVVENDGRPLDVDYAGGVASTSYPWRTDEQHFIATQPAARLDAGTAVVRGGIGDVRPVQLTVPGATTAEVFVYPRSAGDPSAAEVRSSFTRSGDDFSTVVGRVRGTLYVGRTSAGGFGTDLDLDGDGTPDAHFDTACNFVLQLDGGTVTAVEADRPVTATVQGRRIALQAYVPLTMADAPVTVGVTATASSAQNGRPAAAVLDGDPATRWSASGLDETLTLDLGSVQAVSGVRLAFYRGDVRTATFDLRTSVDGASWTPAGAGLVSGGTSTDAETFTLGGVRARYVRVVNRGNSENSWIAVTGAEVVTA
ncbi:discoidin domain-containing protein [Nakamurella deserti]|uniref:discoidin domain-containing protein n=1 Tax=Nakamurella deserti TaxID=2164074 RepID=UPI000DBE539B|nr:discoidin domain-containing protein [Nakamurella deserti]